jgi:hypothetical protein
MPRRCPPEIRRQVVELARAGTRVKQLGDVRDERGGDLSLACESRSTAVSSKARRRIAQLETELAVSRKVNEIFLDQDLAQKPLPGDRFSDRAGHRRPSRLAQPRRFRIGLLRLEGQTGSRRGSCGGSGWPARSSSSMRPRAAPTAPTASRPSCCMAGASRSATTPSC